MKLELVSEDERRKLYEFGKGKEWKVGKLLETKEWGVIGKHYHKNKDECFLVVKGTMEAILQDMNEFRVWNVICNAPDFIFIPRNIYHEFICESGTVIVGLATELHDDNDDHKL